MDVEANMRNIFLNLLKKRMYITTTLLPNNFIINQCQIFMNKSVLSYAVLQISCLIKGKLFYLNYTKKATNYIFSSF